MGLAIKIQNVRYKPARFIRQSEHTESIKVIGIDTEAFTTGKCFMICTSYGDVFLPSQYPDCFFTRKYRGVNFVAYNLKYDSGALLQHLPLKHLQELQKHDETEFNGYTYKVIANKLLSVRKGKNTFHIYDMLNFYNMSLDNASKEYLNKSKKEISTKNFTPEYLKAHYEEIAEYCIQDAVLVKELAELIIQRFESFGVYPRKLYSVAYASWQYFKNNCPWIHVKRYWYGKREVLNYAMQSYNGGKFEVTEKGTGYYYEYDIVSAYPNEIANLIDIRKARIKHSRRYIKEAVYAFLKCKMQIPFNVFSPIAVNDGKVNYYPIGIFEKVITLNEYKYLISQGVNIDILDGYWFLVDKIRYPYKTRIIELMEYKHKFKLEGNKVDYHTVKIFLNAFYGKLVQLIDKEEYLEAGSSWNPIFGSIITANTRLRVTELQQKYPSIIAVHTDSVISTKPLPFQKTGELGEMTYECEGNGVILGSGIYQIGTKSKLRGFESKTPLLELLPRKGKYLKTNKVRPYTWREIAHRSLDTALINKFENIDRKLHINFDTKRIWLNDYADYKEVKQRNVESIPWDITIQLIR